MTQSKDGLLNQRGVTVSHCDATLVGHVDVRIGPFEVRIPAAVVSRCGVLVLAPKMSDFPELAPESSAGPSPPDPLTTAVSAMRALLKAYGLPPWVGGATVTPETAGTVAAEFIANSRSAVAAKALKRHFSIGFSPHYAAAAQLLLEKSRVTRRTAATSLSPAPIGEFVKRALLSARIELTPDRRRTS